MPLLMYYATAEYTEYSYPSWIVQFLADIINLLLQS